MRFFFAIIIAMQVTACSHTTRGGFVGVDRKQMTWHSTEYVNNMGTQAFNLLVKGAEEKGTLIKQEAPESKRVYDITTKLIKNVFLFRYDAENWNWQTAVIKSEELNAACAPGGKIFVYTGIIEKLELTNDELAAILGHEIAHALREHANERMTLSDIADFTGKLAAANAKNPERAKQGADELLKYLFKLPFSRTHEEESDKIGLELMTRAGYDPQAAVSVWEKMERANQAEVPFFLSTHPSNKSRIRDIKALLPKMRELQQRL